MGGRASLKASLVMAIILVGIYSTTTEGKIIYVDATKNGNGSSWAAAYRHLQDALTEALGSDEIWVAEGTYKPDQRRWGAPGDLDVVVGNYNQANKVWMNDGQGYFSDSGQSLGNSYTLDVELGDVDGDKDLDIFEVIYNQPNRVWLNHGEGIFSDSWQSLGGSASLGAALGDVERDGDIDVFVVNQNQPNKVWLNDGQGNFVDSGQSLGTSNSFDVELGDFNGDTFLDAFVANYNQANKIWLNDTYGVFSDSNQSLGSSGSYDVELGDLDGDDDLDAFVANRDEGNRVWLNDGDGIFIDGGQSLGISYSTDVALGDLDGDNDLDAFVANYNQANKVWFNDGDGYFIDSGQSLGISYSLDVELGDLDGDGDLDAIVANRDEGNRVWLNDGQGYFSDSNQSLGTSYSFDAELGDLDDDGPGTGDREATFQLKNGLRIYGGFPSGGGAWVSRDPDAYETILSGDLAGNDVQVDPCDLLGEPSRAENSYRVVTGSGTSAITILDGFTITGGNANGSYPRSYGGGMYNSGGSPTVTNCTFSGNSASGVGGGMCNFPGRPTLTSCTFRGNAAGEDGGGMYSFSESPSLMSCTFEENIAERFGGGMYNSNCNPIVINCTFSGNSGEKGGGMYNENESSPTVSDCNFIANVAASGGGMCNYSNSKPGLSNCTFSGNSAEQGGGMYNHSSSPMVTTCTFIGNSADWAGGIYNYSSSSTATSCTFSGNTANSGGGVYNHFGSPTLSKCTFTGNGAGVNGGGVVNDWSNLIVKNCIFSGNSANSHGGGMSDISGSLTMGSCVFSGNSANSHGGGMSETGNSTIVSNCTFASNSAGNGSAVSCDSPGKSDPSTLQLSNCILWDVGGEIWNDDGSSITITYSDVQGGWGGTGNIDADPQFMDADGGDNIVGTEDDNLRVSGDSPCIDAGDNAAVPPGVTTDLDGNARFVDDPRTIDTGSPPGANAIVDMGAYEYWPAIFVNVDAVGANNGTSWADACNYLQDALFYAQYGDEIWVAEGRYKPGSSRTNTLRLKKGVAVYGGFPDSGSPTWGHRNPRTYTTILSGDIGVVGDNLDNSYHVVTGSGSDANTVLDGFTITAGNANGSDPYDKGGGMFNNFGSLTVTNCTFSGNSANSGGGMCNVNSGPAVTNCTFSGNSAADKGGGMYNLGYSSPTVTNCAFSGNSVTSSGGGMFNFDYSSPTITNCTFSWNSAGEYGGGVGNLESSNPTLTNCIMWGDTAPILPEISNSLSTPTVAYSNVEGCGGSDGGWDPNCGTDGGNNIDTNLLFIGPNGPDGIPGTADDENNTVHLLGHSPCVDAGDPSGDYSGQVDIDGQPRVAYGRVDMGADEVFPAPGDFEPDGDVDFVDFAIFAGRWLLGVE